jgi:hypothetical protein
MKRIIILIWLLQAGSLLSQPVVVDWQRGYGGFFREAEPSMIKIDPNRYIIVTSSNSRNNGDKTHDRCDTVIAVFDIWMYCVDSAGTIIWQQRHSGFKNDASKSVIATSDGGFLIVGTSESDISCEKSQSEYGYSDFWIVKTDSAGNKLWDKRHGGSNGTDWAFSAFETSDGGFIVGGVSDSQLSGNVTDSIHGIKDAWVIKINSSGIKQWDNMYGAVNQEYLYDLIGTSDDGYIFTAWLSGNGTYPNGDVSQNGHGNDDAWVVKCDSAGMIIWDIVVGGDDTEIFQKLFFSYSGYLLALGALDSLSDGWNVCDTLVRGKFDCYISIIDTSTGMTLCDKRFGGNQTDEIFNITETSDGGYIIAANSKSGISYEKTESNRGLLDYWIVKMDSALNIQWDKTFGGSNDDRLAGVVEVTPGSYIAYGSSKSPISGDKEVPLWGGSVPAWMEDIWVIKFHEDSTTGINENSAGAAFSVYPNPVSAYEAIGFDAEDFTKLMIKIISADGAEVFSHIASPDELKQSLQTIFNSAAPGVYMLMAGDERGRNLFKAKIVKQ